jgi:carbamate kinase
MRILVALGGNALLRRDEGAEALAQQRSVEAAADVLAALAREHELVLTHGNGPEMLGAESQGMVGYLLELALRNALPDRDLITVLTEVVVSPDDPAPSPEPRAIAELPSLRLLIDAGVLVICADGGGIQITVDGAGAMRGIEAVVDEDLTASLLARRLDSDLLLLLTDVDAVHLDWGTDSDRALRSASPAELRGASFAPGSIGPKVEAACRFVEATGRRAAVGALADAVEIAAGEAGTQVSPRGA